ncbi:hypothetical protein CC78DRAFT_532960 [Lojkania enalia]|uniref:Uncharacterized protein n=1 Tax=Lojkania enalia TaxID=147567 RepID=A0A9P4KBR1_9PLEO|nr:hypothetical protein CC78DRAFT_532960 [Didymosphaeria enalia]
MVLTRYTTSRAASIARYARPVKYIRSAELQPWQRIAQCRTYASEPAHHGATKTSDLPWAAGALAFTVVGSYMVLTQDTAHHQENDEKAHPHRDFSAKEETPTEEEPEAREEPEEEPKGESEEPLKEETKEAPAAPASPDQSDKPDPRKEPKSSNEMSGKQAGLSNADTHHTSQISEQDEKSKKGEGVAETAKLQGTVSTERPDPTNKEERGKAQQDKSQ